MAFAQMITWRPGTWALLGGFIALLVIGIVLGVTALVRGLTRRADAHGLLDERLARGEISPEEYRERSSMLGPPTRRRNLWPAAVALVAVGLVGSAVVAATGPMSGGGFMHHMMGGMGSMMGGGQPGRTAPEPSEGAREIGVTGTEFSFRPTQMRLAAGETVNVVFENRGTMLHTLTMGELGFELRANGGTSVSGAMRIERAGTYSFICAVSGHADAGMRGTVEVE
jgi:uncharacterized cupredoxin-like copper-binding protein